MNQINTCVISLSIFRGFSTIVFLSGQARYGVLGRHFRPPCSWLGRTACRRPVPVLSDPGWTGRLTSLASAGLNDIRRPTHAYARPMQASPGFYSPRRYKQASNICRPAVRYLKSPAAGRALRTPCYHILSSPPLQPLPIVWVVWWLQPIISQRLRTLFTDCVNGIGKGANRQLAVCASRTGTQAQFITSFS